MTCTNMTFYFSFWSLQRGKKGKKNLVNKDSLYIKSTFLTHCCKDINTHLTYYKAQKIPASVAKYLQAVLWLCKNNKKKHEKRKVIPSVIGLFSFGIFPFGHFF